MHSEALAPLPLNPLLNHGPHDLSIGLFLDINLHSDYSIGFIEAPQMPLANTDYSLDIGDLTEFVVKHICELLWVHLLEEGIANVEAQRDCHHYYNQTFREAEDVF